MTVYYRAADGTRVGYSIVPGHTLTVPGGATFVRHGSATPTAGSGSGRYITWVRGGHTCVIAGREVSNRTLLKLASADESAAV